MRLQRGAKRDIPSGIGAIVGFYNLDRTAGVCDRPAYFRGQDRNLMPRRHDIPGDREAIPLQPAESRQVADRYPEAHSPALGTEVIPAKHYIWPPQSKRFENKECDKNKNVAFTLW
ncbi:hypothetical protein NKH47_18215 [Mesorhizobium sp. M1060]|uniref:hypothetical protein n=1 Tax=unclassified Mesorhizobium TaxID=325217 RepID=UPI0018DC5C3D|nr:MULTISPECIES: hypothetical protein [unclassified Mesorhizobium]WJI54092.1 hypothetical protein NLY44_16240 [Mesorhizobium sp. C089B]